MRGRLDSTTAGTDGKVNSLQYSFLQNLAGPETIIGRSVSIWSEGEKLACCVVGRDASPREDAENKVLEARRKAEAEAARKERERQEKLRAEREAAEKKAAEEALKNIKPGFGSFGAFPAVAKSEAPKTKTADKKGDAAEKDVAAAATEGFNPGQAG